MIILNLDARIGSNLARLRNDAKVSLDSAAYEMRKRGYKWTKMTIHNIEHGNRPIKSAEMYDYLDCLGYTPEKTMQELFQSDTETAARREFENAKTALFDLITQWNTFCNAIHGCRELLDSEAAREEIIEQTISNLHDGLDALSTQAQAFCTCTEVANLQPVDDIDSYLRTEPEQLPAYCFDEEGNLKDPTPDDVDGAAE